MEDAHVTLMEFVDDPNAAFFAVFDGHNGGEVAKFAAEHVPSILPETQEFVEGMYSEALRQTFLAIDEKIFAGWPDCLAKYAESHQRRHLLCSLSRSAAGPGCAALACLLKDDRLHVANAGDCRAVLCRDGFAVTMSTEHRPEAESERRRIEQAGGRVVRGRVNGRLGVSRGLGDFAYKGDYQVSAEEQIVTAYADIATHVLDEQDEFLILACDGIWERRSAQEIIEFVRPRLEFCRQNGQPISSIVEKLLEAVVSPDVKLTSALGCDNMTCIIVDLLHSRRNVQHQCPEPHPAHWPCQSRPLVINVASFVIVAILGWIAGLSSGIAIRAVGAGGLMLMSAGIWICILGFHRVSYTLELGELVIASAIWFLVACYWLAVAHFSHPLSHVSKLGTFSVAGILVFLVSHFFAAVYCREDTRKHSLVHLETATPDFPNQGSLTRVPPEQLQGRRPLEMCTHSLLRWWHDVVIARWWYDIVDWSLPVGDEEAMSQDGITVHNRTLKKVKVCIYASEDCLCWIPLGGVSGSLVRFVPAEQSCVFNLASCRGSDVPSFKLKVFKPSLLDIELACCANVRSGDSFDFCDAEQMMKRSIATTRDSRDTPCIDDKGALAERLMSRARSLSRSCHVPISLTCPERSPNINEILLRNRSQQDIRALLFSTNDYVNWIPIIGKVSVCGDCILPDSDRWFNLKNTDAREFTLKIYDAESKAKELTYLTVKRGQTYIFSNSLLS